MQHNAKASSATLPEGDYFGDCPRCGQNDGYLNIGRSQTYFCDIHKVKWKVGEYSSSWRNETMADWRRNWEQLQEYEEVRPWHRTLEYLPLREEVREAATSSHGWIEGDDALIDQLIRRLNAYRPFIETAAPSTLLSTLTLAKQALETHASEFQTFLDSRLWGRDDTMGEFDPRPHEASRARRPVDPEEFSPFDDPPW